VPPEQVSTESPWGALMPYIKEVEGGSASHSLQTLQMRKIESLMNAAIAGGKDFKLANTEVVSYTCSADVFLHGNLIARIGETWIELFDGGYQTATTKSRLNAVLEANGCGGERVFQKKGEWFVTINNGRDNFTTVPFFSGMRIN
jgi:hypothetical protein